MILRYLLRAHTLPLLRVLLSLLDGIYIYIYIYILEASWAVLGAAACLDWALKLNNPLQNPWTPKVCK